MRFREGITVDRPREEVWGIILDPDHRSRILPWVGAPEVEDPDEGLHVGTRFRTRIGVGSAKLAVLAEVIELDETRDLVLTTVTGVEIRARLRLRDEGAARTRVTVRFSYNAPGVVLGSLAELLSAPMISANVRDSLKRLKRVAEERDAPAPKRPDPIRRLAHEADNVRILMQSGLVAPMRPDKVLRLAWSGLRWGATPAMGVIAGAIRHPNRPMLIDELGTLTYTEVDRRSNAVASALAEQGVCEGDRLGLMCRDHRGFVEAAMAAGKLGVDVLLLNTSFAGPQLAEVCEREQVAALVYDEEFAGLVEKAGRGRQRFVGWADGGGPVAADSGDPLLDEIAQRGDPSSRPVPSRSSHVTILTSGTSGLPKGATRGDFTLTLDPPAALLERIPLREGDRMRIGAPMFHAWGFSNFALGMALGDTFVLRRRFDPEQALRDIDEHGCQALVVVPVMLQRILDLPDDVRARYDTSALRAVCVSGSALPGDLATRWMDAFGENLYNMYGSTEVASATLATPADMRAAPGTAGRPARGSIVKLYDEHGAEVPQGEAGRIFVGNSMLFAGYSGGGSKDVIDGLMSTGDIGRFDEAGRLFVQGRDDEMIVSGGENVFPKEVEDTLARYDGVSEVAAIGVEDEKFGQRLRAFVVLDDGASVTEDELKAHVKDNLARYKVPREIVFLDELPRNPTGKILKRELKEIEVSEKA